MFSLIIHINIIYTHKLNLIFLFWRITHCRFSYWRLYIPKICFWPHIRKKGRQGQGRITAWGIWAFAWSPQICQTTKLFIIFFFFIINIFFPFLKKFIDRKLDLILSYTRNYEFSSRLLKYFFFPLILPCLRFIVK